MARASGIPVGVRAIVIARSELRCERCGRTGPLELHHRRYRSRGGAHTASNLVALCGWGNHTGCHGWAHTDPQAHELGYSLHSWQNPDASPLWRFDAPWLLNRMGGVIPAK